MTCYLIAGYGSIGRRHLRNLQELGEQDLVLFHTGHTTLPMDEVVGIPVESSLEMALKHHPDAVVVSNPTALHLDVAIPAAQMGCHILLEKPVSGSLDQVDLFRDAVKRSGSRVLVGFQYRFHPGLIQARKWIWEEKVGRPISFRCEWGEYLPGWHPWEDYRRGYSSRADLGGGVVLTLCHPLDYLRTFFGEVKGLIGQTGRISDLEIEVEDHAEILLDYANGIKGSLHLDYYRRIPIHRLEITCTGGQVTWDNSDGTARYLPAGLSDWTVVHPPAGFERNNLFLAEMQNFRSMVAGIEEAACSLEDGVKALELALAVHTSARLGRQLLANEIHLIG